VFNESRAEANRGSRLPYSALLIAHDEHRQFGISVTRETSGETGVKLGILRGMFVRSILPEVSLADHLPVVFRNLLEPRIAQPF
jgi:hypothetical protein